MRARVRARLAGLLLAPVLAVWAVVIGVGGARADVGALFRASADANAVNGFYDHQHLVPVPLFDLSVPHAEASLEPGPTTAALGAFVWEPEAAELGTIMCELSNGQACGIPNDPFVARATYPRSGPQPAPPTLEVGDPAPVQVAAADERAAATAERAASDAAVQSLAAIPMNQQQTAAARTLWAAILAVRGTSGAPLPAPSVPSVPGLPGSGPSPSPSPSTGGGGGGGSGPSPWLVAIDSATSSASITNGLQAATSSATSSVHGLSLLGGAITVRAVFGDVSTTAGATTTGKADARWAGLEVGGIPASVGPDGIQVQDQSLGGEQLKTLQDAANKALSQAGLTLSRGSHTVTRQGGDVVAESWALSLDYTAQNVPPGAPQGAGGADMLHLPLGYARAEAEVVELPGPPSPPPTIAPPPPPVGHHHTVAPPPPPPGTGGGGSSGGGFPAGPGSGGGGTHPTHGTHPNHAGGGGKRPPAVRPASLGRLQHGIPAASFVLLALAGCSFVVGMTGLKTLESLTEGAQR